MERLVTTTFEDIKVLSDFVRGRRIGARGAMTAGSGIVTVEDTEVNFTTLGVVAGFFVYDITTSEVAEISVVTATKLTVPAGAWANTNVYEVRSPPIPINKIVHIGQSTDGQWVLCYFKDDGFTLK